MLHKMSIFKENSFSKNEKNDTELSKDTPKFSDEKIHDAVTKNTTEDESDLTLLSSAPTS